MCIAQVVNKSFQMNTLTASEDLVSVLVIDPNDQSRQEISDHLVSTGYIVRSANNFADAFDIFEKDQPAVILCDLSLEIPGDEPLLERLERAASGRPIIILSEAGSATEVVDALRSGASDFLITPLPDLEVLEHSIERCLERYELRQQNLQYRSKLEQVVGDLRTHLAMLQQDQQAGLQVQMKMLPPKRLQRDAYLFSHQIVPSLYLSGDFVEYVQVGSDHVVFFIADVSGHGASSAFVTVLLKNLAARMRSAFNHQNDTAILQPDEFLIRVNNELVATGIGKHATIFYAVLNTRENAIDYSVAGQLPLPILLVDGDAKYLEGEGAPVGLFDEVSYEVTHLPLPSSFRLLMFSDGILEILPAEGLIEKEKQLLEKTASLGSNVEDALSVFDVDEGQQYPDDIAVLVVDRR